MLHHSLIASVIVSTALMLGNVAGCGKEPATPVATAALPAGLFLAAAPVDAMNLHEAKQSAVQGSTVVLHGRIGGAEEPFAKGRAVFTLVDTGVKSCADMGDEDHCPTPWDYCCEPRDNLRTNSATIQIVDADGRLIKSDIKGVRGLKPLADVTVVGTVAQVDASGVFIINATGMFVNTK